MYRDFFAHSNLEFGVSELLIVSTIKIDRKPPDTEMVFQASAHRCEYLIRSAHLRAQNLAITA